MELFAFLEDRVLLWTINWLSCLSFTKCWVIGMPYHIVFPFLGEISLGIFFIEEFMFILFLYFLFQDS